MRWNIGNRIAAAFALSAVIYAGVGVSAYRGLARNAENEARVVHSSAFKVSLSVPEQTGS